MLGRCPSVREQAEPHFGILVLVGQNVLNCKESGWAILIFPADGRVHRKMRECFSEALSQPSDKLSKLLFYNPENKSGNASLSSWCWEKQWVVQCVNCSWELLVLPTGVFTPDMGHRACRNLRPQGFAMGGRCECLATGGRHLRTSICSVIRMDICQLFCLWYCFDSWLDCLCYFIFS